MSSPASILILKSQILRSGGLEKYARHLTRFFAEQGFQVTLLTSGEKWDLPSIEQISLQLPAKVSLAKIWAFNRKCENYVKKRAFDLVFGLDRNRLQTHLRLGNGVHRAYLERRSAEEGWLKRMTLALNPLHKLILSMEKEALESPNLRHLIVNSHLVKEEVLRFYPKVAEDKISVVHNGVEWSSWEQPFQAWPEHKPARAALQLLFVGHNYERKGLHYLLKAMAALPYQEIELSVVGRDQAIKTWQKQAAELGLEKRVTFFGPQSNLIPFYQKADCMVIPSLYDPFANVTLEALAMGLFVITSKHNGGSEILTPTQGHLLSSLDMDLFVKGLKIAIQHPKTIASSQKIRQSVRHLDFPNQLQPILKLCQS